MKASLTTLRFAAGDVTNAIRDLTFSKHVHRKFGAMIRGNMKLRWNGNPNLIHIRRDFGYAQSLRLRRQVDPPDTADSVRGLLEGILALSPAEKSSLSAPFAEDVFMAYLVEICGMHEKFRSALRIPISRAYDVSRTEKLTFDDLDDAVDRLERIAEDVVCALTGSRECMSPVYQLPLLDIFEEPWFDRSAHLAYPLDGKGVPNDALPLDAEDALRLPRPKLDVQSGQHSLSVQVRSTHTVDLAEVRVFVPQLGTIIDRPIVSQSGETHVVPTPVFPAGMASIIVEYSVGEHVLRTYHDVGPNNWVERRVRGPFAVENRIVGPKSDQAA